MWSKVEATGTLPKPRSGHSATLINGGTQLLVFGGCGFNSDFLSDVHILNLSDLKWSQPKCLVRILYMCKYNYFCLYQTLLGRGSST